MGLIIEISPTFSEFSPKLILFLPFTCIGSVRQHYSQVDLAPKGETPHLPLPCLHTSFPSLASFLTFILAWLLLLLPPKWACTKGVLNYTYLTWLIRLNYYGKVFPSLKIWGIWYETRFHINLIFLSGGQLIGQEPWLPLCHVVPCIFWSKEQKDALEVA